MRQRLKHAGLVSIHLPQTRERELIAGRVDVFMTDYPYSRRMLETTTWARLIEPPPEMEKIPYAFALKPGDPVWHSRLEQFVADIKADGRLFKAARKHSLLPIIAADAHAR